MSCLSSKKIIAVEPWWHHHIVLYEDGTIGDFDAFDSSKDGSTFSDWSNICMLDSSRSHVIGLRKDGKVMTYCPNCYDFEAYKEWKDIIQVVAEYEITYALTKYGKILAERSGSEGYNVIFSGSLLGIYIKCIDSHRHALCEDGTLIEILGDKPEIIAQNWYDVQYITSTYMNTYGLRENGTVACLNPDDEIEGWRDIISIASGTGHLLGLKKDGRVVASGENNNNQCDVNRWENITKIFASTYISAGINNKGEVIFT